MRKIILALALALAPAAALAQSSPGLVYGQVPTAGQWNSYFAAKQDVLLTPPCPTTGCTISGPMVFTGSTTFAGAVNQFPAGTVSAPGLSIGVANTGFYGGTASALGITVGGVTKLDYGITAAGGWSVFTGGSLRVETGILGTTQATLAKGVLHTSGAPWGVGVSSDAFLWFDSSTNAFNHTIDTAITRNAAGVLEVDNGTAGTYRELKVRSAVVGGTVPTNSGSCAVTAQTGGNTAGTFTASGACAGGTYIFTFGFTAPTGWACSARDRTTPADNVNQTASSTTTATFTATTANSDVVQFQCVAY